MNLFILLFALVSFCHCAPTEELIKAEVAPVTGGWSALPLDSPEVISMVKLLQNSYNMNKNSLYWSKFTEVEEALVQVTDRINYRITVIIEPTGCLKQEDLETCKTPGFDDMMVNKCHYFIVRKYPSFTPTVIARTCEQM